MQVRYGFAGVRPIVDHESETGSEIELLRELRGHVQEVTKDWLIGDGRRGDARNQFLGNNQKVHGRLWINVVNDDAELVLMFDLRRNFAVDDFLKKRLHGVSWPRVGSRVRVRSAISYDPLRRINFILNRGLHGLTRIQPVKAKHGA